MRASRAMVLTVIQHVGDMNMIRSRMDITHNTKDVSTDWTWELNIWSTPTLRRLYGVVLIFESNVRNISMSAAYQLLLACYYVHRRTVLRLRQCDNQMMTKYFVTLITFLRTFLIGKFLSNCKGKGCWYLWKKEKNRNYPEHLLFTR